MTTDERIGLYQSLVHESGLDHRDGVKKDLLDGWILKHMGFFTAPASTRFHLAYEGGLFDHSVNVYRRLKALTEDLKLEWIHPTSPFVIGMYHDLCKCDNYLKEPGERTEIDNVFTESGVHFVHNEEQMLKGHGEKSVMLLSTFMRLTPEEMYCIRYHMGAYEKDDWGGLDRAIRAYPNVLFTHTADMLASKLDET